MLEALPLVSVSEYIRARKPPETAGAGRHQSSSRILESGRTAKRSRGNIDP